MVACFAGDGELETLEGGSGHDPGFPVLCLDTRAGWRAW